MKPCFNCGGHYFGSSCSCGMAENSYGQLTGNGLVPHQHMAGDVLAPINKKRPEWKQISPIDQFVTIRWALEGQWSNIKSGISTIEKSGSKIDDFINQLHEIEYFLRNPNEW